MSVYTFAFGKKDGIPPCTDISIKQSKCILFEHAAFNQPIQDAIKRHLCRKGYWDVKKHRQLRTSLLFCSTCPEFEMVHHSKLTNMFPSSTQRSWGLSIGTGGVCPSDWSIMGDGEALRMLRQEWNITKQLLIISLMLRWVLQKLPGLAWWHREAFKIQALLTCTLRC